MTAPVPPVPSPVVRPAHPGDARYLPEIEVAAGERFREVGLDAVADDDVESVADFAALVAAERIWVVDPPEGDGDGVPVGYALVSDVGGHVHLDQLSVHPSHQGRGLGAALVEAVVRWAADRGAPSVTLTTFRDVPWNRPWYERRGFVVDPSASADPDLAHVAAWEAAHDFGSPRVWMRRTLGPAGGSAGGQ
ncbi:MAG: GNAT family N-acetyltransferase [Actinobacteria bacterium]|nr:GNAT family N-acetyltransferase [Actinomycetota bacterium]